MLSIFGLELMAIGILVRISGPTATLRTLENAERHSLRLGGTCMGCLLLGQLCHQCLLMVAPGLPCTPGSCPHLRSWILYYLQGYSWMHWMLSITQSIMTLEGVCFVKFQREELWKSSMHWNHVMEKCGLNFLTMIP